MSSSNPFRPSTPPIADEDGESMDSIPWEALDTLGQTRDHRRWYMIAAAVVVVAVGVSAARTLGTSPPDPRLSVTTGVSSPEVTVPTTSTTTTTTAAMGIVTEADLMAIEPHMLQRSAAAFAEVAAAEYFTAFDGGVWAGVEFDRSRSTFVEYATAVEVTPQSQFEFEVLVAVSVLDAGADETFTRRPVRGITIVVDARAGDLRPAGLPSPASLPFRPIEPVSADPVTPGDDVVAAVTEAAELLGEVRSIEFREHPSGGGTATVVIVDEGGLGWPMELQVHSDGTIGSAD